MKCKLHVMTQGECHHQTSLHECVKDDVWTLVEHPAPDALSTQGMQVA